MATKRKSGSKSVTARLLDELYFQQCEDVVVKARPFGRGWLITGAESPLFTCLVTHRPRGGWTLSFPQGFIKKYPEVGFHMMCKDISYFYDVTLVSP